MLASLGLGLVLESCGVVWLPQGSDTDAEQLALTEQLFDAALAELAVVDEVPLVFWSVISTSPPRSLV